jgi:hypothetical protein
VYFIVLAFNLGITFTLSEWLLGVCGGLLALPVVALTVRAYARSRVFPDALRGGGAPS